MLLAVQGEYVDVVQLLLNYGLGQCFLEFSVFEFYFYFLIFTFFSWAIVWFCVHAQHGMTALMEAVKKNNVELLK